MGVHREHMRRRLGLAVPSSTNMMMAEARPHRHAAEQNVVIRTEAQASACARILCSDGGRGRHETAKNEKRIPRQNAA